MPEFAGKIRHADKSIIFDDPSRGFCFFLFSKIKEIDENRAPLSRIRPPYRPETKQKSCWIRVPEFGGKFRHADKSIICDDPSRGFVLFLGSKINEIDENCAPLSKIRPPYWPGAKQTKCWIRVPEFAGKMRHADKSIIFDDPSRGFGFLNEQLMGIATERVCNRNLGEISNWSFSNLRFYLESIKINCNSIKIKGKSCEPKVPPASLLDVFLGTRQPPASLLDVFLGTHQPPASLLDVFLVQSGPNLHPSRGFGHLNEQLSDRVCNW